jgi:hypothetical protein
MARCADDGATIYRYYIARAVSPCRIDSRLAYVGFDNLAIAALCAESLGQHPREMAPRAEIHFERRRAPVSE